MSMVPRRLLHRLFVLLGGVTADQASGGGAEDGVVAGIMSGDAADHRTFDAAFRVGRHCRCHEGQREHRACKNSLQGKPARRVAESRGEVGLDRAQRKLRLSASARSVRSQEKPPSLSGARPKWPYAAVRR